MKHFMIFLFSLAMSSTLYGDTCITAQHIGTLIHVYPEMDIYHAYMAPGVIGDINTCRLTDFACEVHQCEMWNDEPYQCKGELPLGDCVKYLIEECTSDFPTLQLYRPKVVRIELCHTGACGVFPVCDPPL